MTVETEQVALVTGASSGIGAATARELAGAGFTVYGTSRKVAAGEERDGVVLLPLDVTADDSVASVVREVLERSGRIDVLVNNAGLGLAGAAEESSIEQARALFETNLFGSIRMTRAVLPQMREQGSGRVINVSSVLGLVPAPFGALYSATKHAIEGYQARDRGLFGVSGPRGARVRSSSPARRARLHEDLVRRERRPGRRAPAALRAAP
jgi:NAD(P)-dependent dehydrogenase (short-subunit alcohol dehydrogenase family)